MEVFTTADEFIALFEIDPRRAGARDFTALCEFGAMFQHYPQYKVTIASLAQYAQRSQRLSPLVYWSRMKHDLRPVIEASASTLKALGLAGAPTDRDLTCPEIARMVAEYIAERDTPAQVEALADLAAEIAGRIAVLCCPKKGTP